MMRGVLDKKAELSTNEIVALIIGIAIIAIAISFILYPTVFKDMIKNFLPNMKTTTNNDYDVISGSDEDAYPVPKIVPFSIKFTDAEKNGCVVVYVRRINDNLFAVLNSSDSIIGAIEKKSGGNNVWLLFSKNSFIMFYEQSKPIQFSSLDANSEFYTKEVYDTGLFNLLDKSFNGKSLLGC